MGFEATESLENRQLFNDFCSKVEDLLMKPPDFH